MKKVILDCDNTMGVKRSDIDDGLTFAYLYAHDEIDLMGITCTFANNHEHVVYYNTLQMLEDMNISDVPVFKGGRKPESYDSDAVDFLVEQVNKYPNEIYVIAIGSMNNLAGAYEKDNKFFDKVKEIIVMGGMLEPLYLNNSLCKELNFTVDSNSAGKVLFNASKLTLLSSQCTRMAEYPQDEIAKVKAIDTKYIKYLIPIIDEWVKYIGPYYGDNDSFINWDLCTAIYLTNPELFDERRVNIEKDYEAMKTGFITIADNDNVDTNEINIPTQIFNIEKFNQLFYNELSKIKI